MIQVRLVERVDGDWCALIEGREEDAASGPTPEAALGRLVRQRPDRFGIGAVAVSGLDQGLSGEPAALLPGDQDVIGPDSSAPEMRRPGEADPRNPAGA